MNIGDTIKSVTRGMPTLLTGGEPGYRAGDDKLAWAKPELASDSAMTVSSPAFLEGQPIPPLYSVDGKAISPPLSWAPIDRAQSFVLVVEDPDAPTPEPFVHWLLYNLPASFHELPENIAKDPTPPTTGGAAQGKNSNLKPGWTGMAPPKGDTPHRYFFQLFALDTKLDLDPAAGRSALFKAMAGHVLARGRLIGTYHR
jgi:Raf kinase inhibitor-like YbhB/YbcL family protein